MESNKLENLLETESKIKRTAARKGNSRHSRFGTTISVQSVRLQLLFAFESSCIRFDRDLIGISYISNLQR